MLIVCPNCATSYQLESDSLGAAGRSVRCVRCRTMWFASNSDAMAQIARAHRDDVATLRAGFQPVDPTSPSAPPAPADVAPIIDATPEIAPQDPAEPGPQPGKQPGEEASDAPIRDDRGPAPLPEPQNYQLLQPSEAPAQDPQAHAAPTSLDEAVTVIDETPLKPSDTVDIETLAARRLRRPPRRRTRKAPATLATAALFLLAINAGLIAWRADVVRFLPQTASLYAAIGLPVNLRELAFSDIVTHRETHDGVQVLVVEGVIKSQSRRVTELPRLRFAVRNGDGHEIYTWTALPEHKTIAPGGTLPFRSRLASPPPETHAVLVRFFNRRDLGAGFQ